MAKCTVLRLLIALDLGGIQGVWSSVAINVSKQINATSSFPPSCDPVGSSELGRSSTSSLAYPEAPPPPEPLFVAPCPPLAPAPPPPWRPDAAPPLFPMTLTRFISSKNF